MRRRTKPRVVWLPQTNANSLGAGTQVYQLGVITATGATGDSTTLEIPLVLDNQQEAFDVNSPSLSDIENSGYRLRRVVGKLWCECANQNIVDGGATLQPASCIVTAGIIVRRADSTTGGSFAAAAGGEKDINTGFVQNTGDPWIWRRSWTLGNNSALQLLAGTTPNIDSRQNFPTTNFTEYAGGVSDGAHVDQKTARIVSSEERLFLDVSVTTLGEAPGQVGTITVAFWTDFRILGSLRTTTGNRRNASR